VIHVIGGGLAGAEAAWQAARAGMQVTLYEMRPLRMTAAHKTDRLAELVCSNSLKSDQPGTAPWLLKQELRRLGSLLIAVAESVRVPAGTALTVDRELFSEKVTAALHSHPRIEIRREEVTRIPENGVVVIACGPLASEALVEEIIRLTGSGRLFFYDGISPIVEADSVDAAVAFRASRYGKSQDGGADYLNCPLNRQQYERFVEALLEARRHDPHLAEDRNFFEGCLPIEELARRGVDTLRFGPLKPVGLVDPSTGRRPYAAVQLRQENLRADSYNLVGFQTTLAFAEQERVFRMIPGLEQARFIRYGQVHRNTYIQAPALLEATLELRSRPGVFFAGQIAGVEGYVEAIATGLAAGINAARRARGENPRPFPRETAIGSLCAYASGADPEHYQPAGMTFDLLPPLDEHLREALRRNRRARHEALTRRALEALESYAG